MPRKKKEISKDESKEEIIEAEKKNELEKTPAKVEKKEIKEKTFTISTLFFLFTIICSFIYFIYSLIFKSPSIMGVISSFLLTLFSIGFLVVCITSRRKHKSILFLCSILLIGFFITSSFGANQSVSISSNRVQNFSGKSLMEAVKWANSNKIQLVQQYEYSDMVPEYEIIGQSVPVGTKIQDIDEIIISISEGPNPYKEIVIPSMITWDTERVLNFIKTNYLSNVSVDFVESDSLKDTVIEQSKSGNLRRNDEIKLVFSYGDEGNSDEVSLLDFTNMSRFEAEFFMRQHKLNYSFEEKYSDTIKKGYVSGQSVSAGEKLKVNGDKITLTISKGPQIKVPDLTKMTVTELTEWAMENRLKLEFYDQYDESVKSGKVIKADSKEGDIVQQGTTIKVYVSLGKLKMQKFKTVDAFYSWADKYEIKYEVQHEFSDTVAAGEVIRYSYKKGETIKNDEVIVVVISDGAKKGVPDLSGLSKNAAISKLENAGLNYNFIYRSSSASKNTVIAQSISAGSEVSQGTTVTVTLSSGQSSNNNSGNNNSGGNNSGNNNTPSPEPSPSSTPTCNNVTVYIDGSMIDSTPSVACSMIKSAYPSLNFSCSYIRDDGLPNGFLANGNSEIDEHTFSTCDTIVLQIVNNS